MKKPTIICVDDERIVLDSLSVQLRDFVKQGYLVEMAESGEEALEIVDELVEQEEWPFLVIADMKMPKMSGNDLLAKINRKCPETLSILLTGFAEKEDIIETINTAGLYRYMAKPWSKKELTKNVIDAIKYSQSQSDKDLVTINKQLVSSLITRSETITKQNEKLQQMHDDNLRQREAINEQNAKLKNLAEFKQSIINMIAHDIKNSLNSIIGLSERMKQTAAGQISQAGRMILQLIMNMLDVEKYEHSSPKLKLENALVSEIISEATSSVEMLMKDKSIDLVIDLENDSLLKVDREMIVRVFVNLLSNSIKFSPLNSEIRIEGKAIKGSDQELIELSFSDKGEGIDPKFRSYIFEKFWQGEPKKSGMAPSTGLGLSYCKLAVKAHDGDISLRPVSIGAKFVVELPILNKLNKKWSVGENRRSIIQLSTEDLASLRSFSEDLKHLKIHNVSSIIEILDEIDELNLNSGWLEEMKRAVYHANDERYQDLIEMID